MPSITETPSHNNNPTFPSSPAFGTPLYPLRPSKPPVTSATPKTSVLPILLPPATLRPIAFRTFTKKHNLTLTSSALQSLATFVGKHCGSGWREEGLAELLLDEVAKTWKKNGGGVIVEDGKGGGGGGQELKNILQSLEPCMTGGRVDRGRVLSRQNSLSLDAGPANGRMGGALSREDSQASLGMSSLDVADEEEDGHSVSGLNIRSYMKVIPAHDQPRLAYNATKQHFEVSATTPSSFPSASHKAQFFRNRFNLVHQRLLRNEAFQNTHLEGSNVPSLQRSASNLATAQQAYKLTPVANLLGRSGSSHLLFGLLTIAPTGDLTISDLTGSITLDLSQARPVPEDGAWFAPGMIVLVDGVYQEEGNETSTLGGQGGVGGTIGGRFIGLSIGGPPCERREVTLGLSRAEGHSELNVGGGFGWVDFLGVGSERAQGSRMRRIEQRVLGLKNRPEDDGNPQRSNMVIMSEVNLDNPRALEAVRKILGRYAAAPAEEMPFSVVMIGNFVQHAVMAGGGSGGSAEYKEYFDSLASILGEFPSLLQQTTFLFVPGGNDPWASSFSAGAATLIPRDGVPELFTSRIRRAFTSANAEGEQSSGRRGEGEAVWTTNPTRISFFGPVQEMVIFRDDMSGRIRRNAITFKAQPDEPEVMQTEPQHVGPESLDREEIQQQQQQSKDSEMDIDTVHEAESHLPTTASVSRDRNKNKIHPPATHQSQQQQQQQQQAQQPNPDILTARKLVKTLLDQSFLSPFPLHARPCHWDYGATLSLYPLPTALVLADAEAPAFAVTYEGCHVVNPGRVVDGETGGGGVRGRYRWIEFDMGRRRGVVREERL